ncbi:MAG: hypothetical protein MPJ50_04930 [Pirellulales bacterium]|nr:hypothetical protein [Pirellulales bacterium]
MSVKSSFAALLLVAIMLAPASAYAQQSNQQNTMTEREAQQAAQQAERAARAQEAAIQARMRQIETRIAQEEKLLERRMAEANQIRQAALSKNDQRGLDRAAQLEKQAIAAYEASINKLIQAINAPVQPQQANQGGNQKRNNGQPPRRRQPPKRSGWSWWPFG